MATNYVTEEKKNVNTSTVQSPTSFSTTTPSKPLDDAYYSAQAMYSEMYNKAKEQGNATGMRDANDSMNMVRNEYGLAAQFANEDIAKVEQQELAKKREQQKQASAQAVQDYSNYLKEMYEAQKKTALSQLNSAYQSSLNSINNAKAGLGAQYQTAKNQAAGASEVSARNFQEYAAAAGLNSGAGGQAELARNIALQNDMNLLSAQESATIADLELQKTNVETQYQNAIAQAEAEHNYQLASALYDEMVRQNEELIRQEMELYQREQDDLAAKQQVKDQLASYGNAYLQSGTMPSKEMLDAMGITEEDAARYINNLSIQNSLKAVEGTPTPTPPTIEWGEGYSTTTNNGMKASEWAMVKNNIATNLRNKNYQNVDTYMSQIASKLSKEQYNEIADLLASYGYTGVVKY